MHITYIKEPMETKIALIVTFLLVLFLGWIATVNAQPYRAVTLVESKGVQYEIIAFNNSGQILINEKHNSSGNECPILVSERSGAVTRLCDQGLRSAYDLNDRNEVVGTRIVREKGIRRYRAAIWSPDDGLELVPMPDDSLPDSEAYGINNKGEIVGYSFKARKPKASRYASRAFVYSPKVHSRSAIPGYPHSSVAFDINDQGQVILGVTDDTSSLYVRRDRGLEYTYDYNFIPAVLLKDGSIFFASELGLISRDEPRRLKIADDGTLVTSLNTISIGSNYALPIPGIQDIGSSRDDYHGTISVNSSGWIVGLRGNHAYIMKRGYNAVPLDCLFPTNQMPKGIDENQFFSSAYINDRGVIVVSSGDDASEKIIILKPTGDSQSFFNYCVNVELTISEPCSSSFDGNNQIKPLPEGTDCTFSAKAIDRATGKSAPSVELILSKDESSKEILESATTGPTGKEVKFSFEYSKDLFGNFVYVSVSHKSLYFRSPYFNYIYFM